MKVKLDVASLKEGMFVSDLDCDWAQTSFLLEGVLISDDEELAELNRCCAHVYVDTERSHDSVLSELESLASRPPSAVATAAKQQAEQEAEREEQDFQETLQEARPVHSRAKSYIETLMDDVRLGNSLDTATARDLVTEITESITHSPNAMVWLSHLKHRDEYTVTHCMNTCILAVTFGRYLGMNKEELELMGLGALLHDIGKMRVPLEILNKPGRLTPEEFEIIKTHASKGHELLVSRGDIPRESLDVVLHHHERISGKGYPHGLMGERVNRMTKIVSIVDVYDAITSDRCYHDGIAPYAALKNMYEWISEDFEQDLVEQFIKCLGIYPVGSMVQLNLGQIGVVVSASEKSRLRPIVLLVINSKGERYVKPKLINLAHPRWRDGKQKLEIRKILHNDECDIDLPSVIQDESLI
ncbi:HD-GYP domain-containing protein [Thiohalophilus thiocyanatoxydans]|uniref:Putative nucleotidyltransferase with HDIG domain n=1 Tax=Thiohalophilus thiocyanatoxydans TaxID=381308 RepID=A0A4R8ILH4_9GAMM|nr:HD-GYP domain-containing protein [Thiohalophilus thiocyanatoxydans]TDY01651.1 putative nucleotidyltransferase with HDIG domain [Thiohalophilus thiocyanatoxydans]